MQVPVQVPVQVRVLQELPERLADRTAGALLRARSEVQQDLLDCP